MFLLDLYVEEGFTGARQAGLDLKISLMELIALGAIGVNLAVLFR